MTTSTLLYLVIVLLHYAKSADDLKTTGDNLKKIIEDSFSQSRDHEDAMEYHIKAQEYIQTAFKDSGIETELQKFASDVEEKKGTNVIGVMKGSRAGTADDSVMLIGGHYDTTRKTPGVDNNGSGLSAIIEALKSLKASGFSCKNTILFAAFDLKENDEATCKNGTCGSNEFVNNWLKTYLADNSAKFQGAIILDTIMNYDNTETSQNSFLTGDEFVSFNEEMTTNKMKGNFLFCTSRSADSQLTDAVVEQWGEDADYKFMKVQIPIEGRPTEEQSSKYEFLLDSDHRSFWNNDQPYKAIYLTDTALHRGVMRSCYHRSCDNSTTMLTDQNLLFAAKTTQTIKNTLAQLAVCESTSAASGIYSIHVLLMMVVSAVASYMSV
ncbi:uncharacterized protein LOC144436214 isoform X2 [Glandiceps talaboti]